MTRRFVKPANALSAGVSYLKSMVTANASPSGMPVALSAELSAFCNLRCPECASGSGLMTRERGYMNIDLYRKLISETGPFIYQLNLYFQGEPMLHPDFFSFLTRSGNYRLIVSTNGHFLSEEKVAILASSCLTEIIVSLDGMDRATYSDYRCGGDFEVVAEGIRNLSAAIRMKRSSLKLTIQYLVTRNNEHQIPRVREFAAETNAKLRLKSMQICSEDHIPYWQPRERRFSRYEATDGKYGIRSTLPDRCARIWFNPVVTWEGLVVPCCFDKDARFVMGDLRKNSFSEIWNGKEYRNFRRMVSSGRSEIEICKNCTSGMKFNIIR